MNHPAHTHIANTIIPRKLNPQNPASLICDGKWEIPALGEPVMIWWWDAVTNATDWEHPDETTYQPEPTVTIGFLWDHTPTHTTLTALTNTTNHSHTLTIPNGCIHTLKHLNWQK